MAQILATVETRITDVLENGRGLSGMSATAALRAIETGRYRRSVEGADLSDAAYPLESFDRAYDIQWEGESEEPDQAQRDEMSDSALSIFTFTLRVGFLYGAALDAFKVLAPSSSESASTLVARVRRQALSDERSRLLRALTFQEIVQSTSDPNICTIERAGPASIQDLGGGRLLLLMPLRVRVYYGQNTSYND